jgi:hypothetical protein
VVSLSKSLGLSVLYRTDFIVISTVSDYSMETVVRSPVEAEDTSSSLCVQTNSEAHPASCTVGTGGHFLGGKARPERDADYLPSSSAEVENE